MLRVFGLILLAFSCLLFILIPVIPFVGFSKGTIAWLTTTLFISGEVLFYLSIFMLVKSYWAKFKSKLIFWKPKTSYTQDKI